MHSIANADAQTLGHSQSQFSNGTKCPKRYIRLPACLFGSVMATKVHQDRGHICLFAAMALAAATAAEV